MKKRILISGQDQAGSTVLYNFVRFLHRDSGFSVYGALATFYEKDNPADIHVIKWHAWDAELYDLVDLVITPRRNLRDSVASARRRWPEMTVRQIAESRLQHYLDWAEVSDYEFVYEDFIANPLQAVTRLKEFLLPGVNIDIDAILMEADALRDDPRLPPQDDHSDNFYLETLLSRSHMTNSGKVGGHVGAFTPDEERILDEVIGPWLREKGYE